MSLTVKISINDHKGKSAEIELRETDNLAKLVIIQNVFNLFGIDTDVMDMAATFEKVGKAYSHFFKEVENKEVKVEKILHNAKEIKEKMIEGYKESIQEVYKTLDDQPEYVKTGIKVDPDGTKRYRCRYQCPLCLNKGTHYVYVDSKETWCHSCKFVMKIYPANPKGVLEVDTFGNFFRAGDYQDFNLT